MSSGTSLLLDSHIWLWLIFEVTGTATKESWSAIRSHVQEGRAAVSDITFWECALNAARGKLQLGSSIEDFLGEARRFSRVGVIEVDRDTLIKSALMRDAHRDPVDRIIMATAMKYDMTVATADRNIIGYARQSGKFAVLEMGWE